MPSLENAVPLPNQNQLMRREMRGRKLLRYLQITEVPQLAMSLRRESKEWTRMLQSCMSMGVAGLEAAAICQKNLMATREMMLEIVGMPKRPSRAVVNERLVHEIRDAIPEEIEVSESGPPNGQTCAPRE